MKIIISGKNYTISSPAVGAMRIWAEEKQDNGLDRYGVTESNAEHAFPAYDCADGRLSVKDADGNILTTISIIHDHTGWKVFCTLREANQNAVRQRLCQSCSQTGNGVAFMDTGRNLQHSRSQ